MSESKTHVHTTRDFYLAVWLLYKGCKVKSVFARGSEQSFTFDGVTDDVSLAFVNGEAHGDFAGFCDSYRRCKQLLQDARMTSTGRSDHA